MNDDPLLRQIIVDLPRGSRILDLGSGNGGQRPTGWPVRYAKVLGKAGFQVTAVDTGAGVGLPWPGVEYVQTSVEDFVRVHQRQYHLVICSNVLQCVDVSAIADLPKLVAPGGYLFVRTFANLPKVLEALRALDGLELLDERTYTVQEDHPLEGPHSHEVVELVFRRWNGLWVRSHPAI